MKRQYVMGLGVGDKVRSEFAVRSVELRLSRTGDPYLALELADRTGVIPAVWFRPSLEARLVSVGDVARVTGTVTTYRGSSRVSARAVEITAEYDRSDLMPVGRRDVEELLTQLSALVVCVRDPLLRTLVHAVLGEGDTFRRFAQCPASQSHHHAWLGGLLEHTVSVATSCREVAGRYDAVDADLLTAAALLHDVGKIDEIAFDTCIGYTDAGRLLGHVVLGERRVTAAVRRVGAGDDVALRLAHVLVSHHGELEWGSPKRPAMLEALILHHVDNLDAKVAGFIDTVSSATHSDARWTDVTNLFRRPLFVPRAVEDDRSVRPSEDEQYYLASAG